MSTVVRAAVPTQEARRFYQLVAESATHGGFAAGCICNVFSAQVSSFTTVCRMMLSGCSIKRFVPDPWFDVVHVYMWYAEWGLAYSVLYH